MENVSDTPPPRAHLRHNGGWATTGLEKGEEGKVRACQSKGCLHASLTFPRFWFGLQGPPHNTLRGTNQGLCMHVLLAAMQQPASIFPG